MSAPRRWKDSPDAPTGVRELLSAARPSRAIPEETFARGVVKVAQRTAVPVVAVTAIGLWTKIAIASVALVAVTASVVGVRAVTMPEAQHQAHDEATPHVVVAPQAKADAAPKAEPEPAPVEVAKSVPPAPVRAAPVRAEPVQTASMQTAPVQTAPMQTAPMQTAPMQTAPMQTAPMPSPVALPEPVAVKREASTLVEELSLLEAAQRAVARDPSRALAGVAQHRARFPTGTLGAERDLVELDALKRLGRNEEARARADAWLAREPAGVYAQRVKAIRATLD